MFVIFKVCADGSCGPKEIEEDLHSLQAEVGGNIEPVYIFSKGCPVLIVNEEGRLLDLPDNKCIPGIKGDAFFIGIGDENFISLTPSQVKSLCVMVNADAVKKGAV